MFGFFDGTLVTGPRCSKVGDGLFSSVITCSNSLPEFLLLWLLFLFELDEPNVFCLILSTPNEWGFGYVLSEIGLKTSPNSFLSPDL